MATHGLKYDQEKPDMDLLSPFALEKVAKVMTFGKKKYGANNWRQGIEYSRLLAAVSRHLNAYRKGESLDIETGLSHLAHASCGLMMLLEFEETRPDLDDRYFKNSTLIIAPTKKEVQEFGVGSASILPEIIKKRVTSGGMDSGGAFVILDDGQKIYEKSSS